LMAPAVCGRDGHRRDVRHESGEIIIPLGATATRWKPPHKPLQLPSNA
jgi:hypothetical protein